MTIVTERNISEGLSSTLLGVVVKLNPNLLRICLQRVVDYLSVCAGRIEV